MFCFTTVPFGPLTWEMLREWSSTWPCNGWLWEWPILSPNLLYGKKCLRTVGGLTLIVSCYLVSSVSCSASPFTPRSQPWRGPPAMVGRLNPGKLMHLHLDLAVSHVPIVNCQLSIANCTHTHFLTSGRVDVFNASSEAPGMTETCLVPKLLFVPHTWCFAASGSCGLLTRAKVKSWSYSFGGGPKPVSCKSSGGCWIELQLKSGKRLHHLCISIS